MNLSSAKYRITYEAFSKFSSSLGKAETLEDLGKTINRHLNVLDRTALDSYVPLSQNALNMARLRGLSSNAIWDIEQLLGQWDEQD